MKRIDMGSPGVLPRKFQPKGDAEIMPIRSPVQPGEPFRPSPSGLPRQLPGEYHRPCSVLYRRARSGCVAADELNPAHSGRRLSAQLSVSTLMART